MFDGTSMEPMECDVMETEKISILKQSKGHKIDYFFDDNSQYGIKRSDVIYDVDDKHLYILNQKGNIEGINLDRIIRFEILNTDENR